MILAPPTTDDVGGMSASGAVITELGGSTSHTAVVCRGMGVSCVVGCGAGSLTTLASRTVTVGGAGGTVYVGVPPVVGAKTLDDADRARSYQLGPGCGGADTGDLPTSLRARA